MAKSKTSDNAAPEGAILLDGNAARAAVPVHAVAKSALGAFLDGLAPASRAWLTRVGFEAGRGSHALVPGDAGELAMVALGLGDALGSEAAFEIGGLSSQLPEGDYRLASGVDSPELAAIAWAMGSYTFDRYRSAKARKPRRLVLPDVADRKRVSGIAGAVAFGRDLINTPASDMGPDELEAAARDLARHCKAEASSIVGDALLAENYPMIHAVGRASVRAPRLVELRWGRTKAPRVTLVGKGICFDSGGLNVKTGDGMTLMKKDMGGAATALALGRMIMEAGLDVNLRILLAVAENAISGNAFRPGDVLKSRNGMTVEIGNTDAEGRLVLADALAAACEEKPATLLSFATLTGAARVALGPDLPPLYCDDDDFAAAAMAAGRRVEDPLWRMPLWAPYDRMLSSPVADVNHVTGTAFAGSVTAALFLKRFVRDAGCFAHFDIYGWVPKAKPGKPQGGEPQGARAMLELLSERYG
ncbi:MAG: leucyl aminopeptidase family protein [Hyphomicrobiaceae bacterium]